MASDWPHPSPNPPGGIWSSACSSSSFNFPWYLIFVYKNLSKDRYNDASSSMEDLELMSPEDGHKMSTFNSVDGTNGNNCSMTMWTNITATKGMEPPSSNVFNTSHRPTHYSILRDNVKQYSQQIGFIVRDNPKAYLTKDWFKLLYPDKAPKDQNKKIPTRGRWLCSPLSYYGQRKGDSCPFQISYLLPKESSTYTITLHSCFSHSHGVGSHLKEMEGRKFVNFEGDLTQEENFLIENLSYAKLSIPQCPPYWSRRAQAVHLYPNY